MCGINGFVRKDISIKESEHYLAKMNDMLEHRGPDDRGSYIDSKNKEKLVSLGQRRLSIIDLSVRGFQPMSYHRELGAFSDKHNKQHSGKEQITITFNGEIYNYLDLKKELQEQGYVFSTQTDTEVILAAYLAYGQKCVEKFNGMRAFCIYDCEKGILFCSRDRFGQKPFYYFSDGSSFVFSSEIKPILEHKDLKIKNTENISQTALEFYFTLGFIPAPHTIYKNISKLEAGHNLILDIKNYSTKKELYYEIPDYEPIYDKKHLDKKLSSIFADATKIRSLASDVPVGAFLSGGLDSSCVVNEMRYGLGIQKLNTFSIGFEGKYDETPYIDIVKEKLQTEHHHQYFTEEKFKEYLNDIRFFYDEPLGDYSIFPTRFVSALAREEVTVSLSGDGGDEMLGGYDLHKIGAQILKFKKIPKAMRIWMLRQIKKVSSKNTILEKLNFALKISLLDGVDFCVELFTYNKLNFPSTCKERLQQKFTYLLKKNKGDIVQSLIGFDLLFYTLADNYLQKVDRASMANSLEVRSPFMDYRFAELLQQTPSSFQVSMRQTKMMLRNFMKHMFPKKIIYRKKQGFVPPIAKRINTGEYDKVITKGMEVFEKKKILTPVQIEKYKKLVQNGKTKYTGEKTKILFLTYRYNYWIEKII